MEVCFLELNFCETTIEDELMTMGKLMEDEKKEIRSHSLLGDVYMPYFPGVFDRCWKIDV